MNEDFELKRVLYEERGRQFRAINDIFWKIPGLSMTLTGGIWFGISKVDDADWLIKFGLYLLASIGNLGFLVALWRLRVGVMEVCLNEMDGLLSIPDQNERMTKRRYVVIAVFSVMLLISASIGGWGAYQEWCASSPKVSNGQGVVEGREVSVD